MAEDPEADVRGEEYFRAGVGPLHSEPVRSRLPHSSRTLRWVGFRRSRPRPVQAAHSAASPAPRKQAVLRFSDLEGPQFPLIDSLDCLLTVSARPRPRRPLGDPWGCERYGDIATATTRIACLAQPRVYCLMEKVTFTWVPSFSVPRLTRTARLLTLSSPETMPPTFPSELLVMLDTAKPADFRESP